MKKSSSKRSQKDIGSVKRGRTKAANGKVGSTREKGRGDDLTFVEGIGPKTADKLAAAGIDTFEKLAALSEKQLRAHLAAFGPRFGGRDCSTWRQQAKLAAAGDTNTLAELQSRLVDGRRKRGKRHQTKVVRRSTKPAPAKPVQVYVESKHAVSGTRPYPIEKLPTSVEFRRECEERRDELEKERRRVERACKKLTKRIDAGEFGTVLKCFPGFRRKLGRFVSPVQYVIVVSVPYKIPIDQIELADFDALPSEFENIQVKVVECRPYLLSSDEPPESVFPNDAPDFASTVVIGGLPCAACGDEANWGTLGICFRQKGDQFAVVNAHFAAYKDEMLQPPALPNKFDRFQWGIGEVVESEYLTDVSGGGTIDAALIKISLNNRSFSDGLIENLGSNRLFDETIYFAGDRLTRSDQLDVFKVGARTQLTRGVISDAEFGGLVIDGISLKSVIEFYNEYNNTVVDCGDSGSALVATLTNGLLVLGIVFAADEANPHIGYACHFADLISQFSLDGIDNILFRKDWDFA